MSFYFVLLTTFKMAEFVPNERARAFWPYAARLYACSKVAKNPFSPRASSFAAC